MNIKFRVWNDTIGRYEEDSLNFRYAIDMNGNLFINEDGGCDGECLDDNIIEQFTGLKDKNGKDIYEGDILNHHIQGKVKVYYPFDESRASFGLIRVTSGAVEIKNLANNLQIYEVVGNIHQNKEFINE